MIAFPYGIADFRRLRREGMVYVDRTAFIRELEMLGSVLVFLRPRRFGKSLWLQTLANYYDVRRAGEFEDLFGGLAIAGDGQRGPTSLRNRYFILQWNFSEVDPRGGIDQIAASLREHVASRARAFVADYEDHLTDPVPLDGSPAAVLDALLAAVRKTPFKVYLLVDEYDNFINEVLVRDVETYRALLDADGPFKQLFKSVKAAFEGRGLDRVFMTGVSPIALNDLTSGFNVAKNVSLDPALGTLCGFRETEIHDLLTPVASERELSEEVFETAMTTMRTWYNGYRFTHGPPVRGQASSEDLVYNPTNALYFLEHVYRWSAPPRQLHDENLRTDHGKLRFLASVSSRSLRQGAAAANLIEELTEGDGEIAVSELRASFSLDDVMTSMANDRTAVASFLYYMGLLTLTGADPLRLRIPNLVVRKLLFDRLLEIYLHDRGGSSRARERLLGEEVGGLEVS